MDTEELKIEGRVSKVNVEFGISQSETTTITIEGKVIKLRGIFPIERGNYLKIIERLGNSKSGSKITSYTIEKIRDDEVVATYHQPYLVSD